jgi:hypothetical protein
VRLWDDQGNHTRVVFPNATVEARFRHAPQIRVFERGTDLLTDVEPTILSAQYNTLSPVAEEVYVRAVPDPAAFRELCDAHCSREAILQALQS